MSGTVYGPRLSVIVFFNCIYYKIAVRQYFAIVIILLQWNNIAMYVIYWIIMYMYIHVYIIIIVCNIHVHVHVHQRNSMPQKQCSVKEHTVYVGFI